MKHLILTIVMSLMVLGGFSQTINSVSSRFVNTWGKQYQSVEVNVDHNKGDGLTCDVLDKNRKRMPIIFAAYSFGYRGNTTVHFNIPVTPGIYCARIRPVFGPTVDHWFYVSPYYFTPTPIRPWSRSTVQQSIIR